MSRFRAFVTSPLPPRLAELNRAPVKLGLWLRVAGAVRAFVAPLASLTRRDVLLMLLVWLAVSIVATLAGLLTEGWLK